MVNRRIVLAGLGATPLAACATPMAMAAPSLRLATFNIWHNQGDWPARQPLVIQTLRDLDADVIALQEVLEDADVGLPNQADTIAAALGGYSVTFSSRDAEGARRRYGNAVLTRLPILAHDWKALEPLDDYRTAVRVRVDNGGAPIDIVGTHFHHTDEGAAIRARQAADLLAWVGDGDVPLIVMGDFNAPLTDPGLSGFTSGRFISGLPAGTVTTTFQPPTGPVQTKVIDHIFVEAAHFTAANARVTGRGKTEGVQPSDHFAVSVTAHWIG